MKFSIILPCYNVEKYIRACIDSILQQTYKDFEVILVDDGARDSTPQICDEYAEKDTRVRTIHKPNGGQADARNIGLEAAQGDYICYVDSDDFLANDNVLQLLADKTDGNPDIVHYKFQEWFESDGHIAPCRFDYRIPTKGRSVADIYCDLIDKDAYYNSAWSKIIRRGLLMENEIRFEKGIVGEDNEWYYHVVRLSMNRCIFTAGVREAQQPRSHGKILSTSCMYLTSGKKSCKQKRRTAEPRSYGAVLRNNIAAP